MGGILLFLILGVWRARRKPSSVTIEESPSKFWDAIEEEMEIVPLARILDGPQYSNGGPRKAPFPTRPEDPDSDDESIHVSEYESHESDESDDENIRRRYIKGKEKDL